MNVTGLLGCVSGHLATSKGPVLCPHPWNSLKALVNCTVALAAGGGGLGAMA